MSPVLAPALACAALLIEAAVGYPSALLGRIGHPVIWIGRLIAFLDARLNREALHDGVRWCAGVVALVIIVGLPALVAGLIQMILGGSIGFVLLALLAASLPAQRSLYTHVADVAAALEVEGLAGGRTMVARIVGRDPDQLDEAGVSRAAIESLAENFSDGVVAPLFWTAVLGLPGGVVYKAANTADSMIGHRTPRHRAFGWAAARFDDLINLPASRLAALWLIVAATLTPGYDAAGARLAVARDARRHRSPNAGWPEAAMAGALGLKLAGPRVYGGEMVADAFMGSGRREATAGDIRRALRLYRRACVLQAAVLMLVAGAVIRVTFG